MATKSIWGFGSLNLRNSGYDISFPYALQRLYFEPVKNRQTAITGKLHQTQNWFRPYIQCVISICNDSDIENLISLVQMLNFVTSDPIYITPNYSVTNTENNEYEVYIDSDQIQFAQLANAEVGQSITLVFIGRTLTKLPTNISNAVVYNLVDQLGNQFVDELGNTITVRTA